jgi:tetratricopeptide (TPR) repeat protein
MSTSTVRGPWSAAALAVALLAGCREGAARGSGETREARNPAAPAALGGRAGQVAAFAFAAPGGEGPADRRVLQAQERLRRPGASSGATWAELGRAWLQKAREAADPGFYLHADACAEAALAEAPGAPDALLLRGLVHQNAHRFQEALRVADDLLARRPDDAAAHGLRSDALLELGREEEAVPAAQRMMSLKPNAAAYVRASYLLWLRSDTAGARRAARLAIQAAADPSDPEPRAWAITQAAHMFWLAGDLDGAEAGHDLALAELPSYPPALAGKARIRLARGEAGAAARLAAESWRRAPLAATAWLLGDARAAAGDAPGAREAYARVVQDGRLTDPRTLGLFLATKGRDVEEALTVLARERAVRRDVYTEDAWAWALYRAGRLDEAKAASDRAVRLGTPDPSLLFHAGAIRIALGQRAQGRRLVARALALNPRFDPTGAGEAQALAAAERRSGERPEMAARAGAPRFP